jgi:diguanylate cyclase (GGDEF)-like protein
MTAEQTNPTTIVLHDLHSTHGRGELPLACLVVLQGQLLGQRIDIGQSPLLIGRSDECGFRIADNSVSRKHAQIWCESSVYRIKDLGSTNHTLVNHQPITETELQDGDRVTIGKCVLKFMSRSTVEARYHEEMYRLAAKDSLTGIYNRRQFTELLGRELTRATLYKRPLALLSIDLDHFKQINDDHGHLAGDDVLRQVAATLQQQAREDFVVARIGGEEFAVVLPEHDACAACRYAEMLRAAIAMHQAGEAANPVTVSIGVAVWAPAMNSVDDLLREADMQLYRAKQSGRNRVCPVAEPNGVPACE